MEVSGLQMAMISLCCVYARWMGAEDTMRIEITTTFVSTETLVALFADLDKHRGRQSIDQQLHELGLILEGRGLTYDDLNGAWR